MKATAARVRSTVRSAPSPRTDWRARSAATGPSWTPTDYASVSRLCSSNYLDLLCQMGEHRFSKSVHKITAEYKQMYKAKLYGLHKTNPRHIHKVTQQRQHRVDIAADIQNDPPGGYRQPATTVYLLTQSPPLTVSLYFFNNYANC